MRSLENFQLSISIGVLVLLRHPYRAIKYLNLFAGTQESDKRNPTKHSKPNFHLVQYNQSPGLDFDTFAFGIVLSFLEAFEAKPAQP